MKVPLAPEETGYRVDDLIIDVGRQRVSRGDTEIPLPQLSFDVLLALARSAPNVVSFDALIECAWPNLVVSQETVTQRIKLVRDALGDDAHTPRYIAGVRGRGYRVLASVTPLSAPASEAAVAAPLAPASVIARPIDHKVDRLWISTAVCAVVVLVAGILIVSRLRDRGSSQLESMTQPTSVTVRAARTIAVLPFVNFSGKSENDYVALGIAETVLHRLATLQGLGVVARTSSFAVGNNAGDVREIGRALNVQYLVIGAVQRADDRLRVTAQLVDTSSGAQLWSMNFDRTMDDIFAVQDEISYQVARALEVSAISEASDWTTSSGTKNLQAYLAYLQGRALLSTRVVGDVQPAIERFSRALEIDPAFGAGYAGLAMANWDRFNHGLIDEASAHARVKPLIAKALALDDSIGYMYSLRAWITFDENQDAARAEADFRRGIALSPYDAATYRLFAEWLFFTRDRREEALALVDKVRVIDPLTARNHYAKAQMLYVFEGDSDQVQALFMHTLKLAPNYHPALGRLAQIESRRGEFAKAVEYGEQAIGIDPESFLFRLATASAYVDLGDASSAKKLLEGVRVRPDLEWAWIALHDRDWARAGEALLNLGRQRDERGMDLEAYVIRDYGLATGNLKLAEDDLTPRTCGPQRLEQARRPWGCVYHNLALAHVLRESGSPARSRELVGEAQEWIDQEETRRGRQHFSRERAIALALLGDRDAALEALWDAFHGGRHNWWSYTLESDPVFADLRTEPRFRAIVVDARSHAARQRALLEEMRRQGRVPTR